MAEVLAVKMFRSKDGSRRTIVVVQDEGRRRKVGKTVAKGVKVGSVIGDVQPAPLQ